MEQEIEKKGLSTGMVFGLVIVAVIIFGKATKEQGELNMQSANLQKETSSTEKADTQESTTTKNETDTTDKKVSSPADTTTATTDWKTYKNTKYGYSLNYPNNFELYARDESLNNVAVSPAAASIDVSNNDEGGIFDVIFENIQFTTDGMKGVFDETDPSKVTLTPATIAGNPAYQVKYDAVSDESDDLYFVKSPSGAVLRLMIARNNSDAQKILSSFIFTK